MVIHGFQKMTLLDYPGKVACTIFTAGCNFRCPFCHNARLVTQTQAADRISEADVLTYLEKRKGILDGVCITGGEPTLQSDLSAFIRTVRSMGYAVKLDTNGTAPDILSALLEERLVDYVAMDVKNTRERYAETTGVPKDCLASVEQSVCLLIDGTVDYEFRTTVVKELHTPGDIAAIARWISGAPRYFLQPFVDSGCLIGKNLHAPDSQQLDEMLRRAKQFVPTTAIRGA